VKATISGSNIYTPEGAKPLSILWLRLWRCTKAKTTLKSLRCFWKSMKKIIYYIN